MIEDDDDWTVPGDPEWVPTKLDMGRPSTARMWDYYLGGKDNFDPDREAAKKVTELFGRFGLPAPALTALANRRFIERVVVRLCEDAGIRQFLREATVVRHR